MPYKKAKDGRGAPIRGLWKYGDKFLYQKRVAGNTPRKLILKATTVAEAINEMKRLQFAYEDNPLKHIGKTASFMECVNEYYTSSDFNSKKPNTQKKEKFHLNGWMAHMGGLEIARIRPALIDDYINKRRRSVKGRTCNLDVSILNNVLNRVKKVHRVIDVMPTEFYRRMPEKPPKRQLLTMADINKLINVALQRPNGQQLADFIRLGYSCGAREQEMLRLRWDQNVDWNRRVLLIGNEGEDGVVDTKNGEYRHVQFNGVLEAHLKDMHSRRKDETWLFPSIAKGFEGERTTTLRGALRDVKLLADMIGFGWHDLRHYFISYSVMSGIDFLTVAAWAGHKDGGVLIGKVYGHLADSHKREMARKINLGMEEQPRNVVSL